jgi:serine/threonine-protein kinase
MAHTLPPEDWARVERLFAAAMERPAEERAAWLREQAAEDEWLLGEVASLVQFAETEASAPLQDIVDQAAREAGGLGTSALGKSLGPYRLEAELGRGGMGVVYLGVREGDDFEQRVAIKLLPGALYSNEMTWRFRNERRILASLDHPGVARFLDGGTTPEGLPYAVMELVEGEPIDAYCARLELSVDRRLELFVKVCEAVAYAHSKLVVHRDLKPANILVDTAGSPRLLDFGIAKLMEPGEDPERPATRIMTPHFASPEQFAGAPATTAADVYALGALLYVLLTGRKPHEGATSPTDLARLVAETDPPMPSVVTGNRVLAGDLDTIVLKAMRREPAERYPSVDRLLQDVVAYRASLPISAAPPTWTYRARKFLRRNRAGVAAGVVALTAVLTGGVMATVGMVRAQAAEADAEQEARLAAEVSDFLVDLFGESDPDNALGEELTARALLDAGVARIDQQLMGQPALQANLKQVMARSYAGLGDVAEAERLYREALDVADSDELQASLLAALGGTLRSASRFPEALSTLDEAIRFAGARVDTSTAASMRETPELSQALVQGLQERGVALTLMSDSAGAISLLERVARLRERVDGPEAEATATTLIALASAYSTLASSEDAQPLHERAIRIYESLLDPRHPALLTAYGELGALYARREVFDSAATTLEKLLPLQQEVLGPTHPRTVETLRRLGSVNSDRGAFEPAERYMRQALELDEARLGPRTLSLTLGLNNLAVVKWRQGDHAEAKRLFQRATEIRREMLGPDNPRTISTLLGVANMSRLEQEWEESAEAYAEAIRYLRPDGVTDVLLRDYAQVLRALGREPEALALDEELAARGTR